MQNWSENRIAFLLTTVLFVVSYLIWGWWTDSYQTMYDFAMSGELTEFYWPSGNALPEYMPGGTWLFNQLTSWIHIRWISLFMNSLLFISVFLIYRLLWLKTKDLNALSRWGMILFFTGFFIESVVLYHMVRTTMFVGIASLVCVVLESDNERSWFKWKYLPYLALFSIAMWIRCNVHLFVLLFLSFALVLHGRSLKPLSTFYVVFIVAFGYYFNTVFVADHSESSHFSFMYDWEFKLYHTGDYEKNLDFTKVEGDSIRYLAASNGILGDEKNINDEFFERVNAFGKFNRFGPEQLKRAWSVFVYSMGQNLYYLLADLLLLIAYLILGGQGISHFKRKTFLLFAAFYSILLAISIIKMENRFLVPFQMALLLFVVLKHKPNLFYQKKYVWLLFLFLLIDTPYTLYGTQQKIDYGRSRFSDYRKTMDYLANNHQGEILVLNGVLNPQSRPFQTFEDRNNFKEVYFYNYLAVALSPTFRPYLENECNCDVGYLYTFYEYLAQLDDEVVLIDNPDRIEILEAYLEEISDPEYRFERIVLPDSIASSLNNIGYQGDNGLYQLSRSNSISEELE